jgi:hypothetical protein
MGNLVLDLINAYEQGNVQFTMARVRTHRVMPFCSTATWTNTAM